jgi:tRNA threonylcarbamoyladenosine biosynthesis protein TsaB
MNCLAIDTSSDYLSLAIRHGDRVATLHEPADQAHAERALPGIRRLLDELGISLEDLDAVVYGQGPGSFTGLRIACGLAQGLAFAAGLKVIGIPTLDCMAAQAQGRVIVCLDARMHQVYTAAYDTTAWQRLTPITLLDPAQVTVPDDKHDWTGVGNGFAVYAEALADRLAPQLAGLASGIRPQASTLLSLAQSGRYAQVQAHEAGLLYIRDKVALTSIEQKAQRK